MLVQPPHHSEKALKLGIIERKSGQPLTDRFALPPGWITRRRKLIAIKPRANEMRRCVRKWIVREERECPRIVVQKFPNKMQRPGIFRR